MQIHELNTLGGTPGSTDFLAIDTGFDTAKISAPNLLKPLKEQTDNLNNKKINIPLDEYNQPTYGNAGQLLRTKGDGSTEWVEEGLPSDEQTAQAVSDWLDDHPEATTTVADGSLTDSKFSAALKLKTIKDYVTPQMFGAAGDGAADDSDALENAFNSGKNVFIPIGQYRVTRKIDINDDRIIIIGEKALTRTGTGVSENTVLFADASFSGDYVLSFNGHSYSGQTLNCCIQLYNFIIDCNKVTGGIYAPVLYDNCFFKSLSILNVGKDYYGFHSPALQESLTQTVNMESVWITGALGSSSESSTVPLMKIERWQECVFNNLKILGTNTNCLEMYGCLHLTFIQCSVCQRYNDGGIRTGGSGCGFKIRPFVKESVLISPFVQNAFINCLNEGCGVAFDIYGIFQGLTGTFNADPYNVGDVITQGANKGYILSKTASVIYLYLDENSSAFTTGACSEGTVSSVGELYQCGGIKSINYRTMGVAETLYKIVGISNSVFNVGKSNEYTTFKLNAIKNNCVSFEYPYSPTAINQFDFANSTEDGTVEIKSAETVTITAALGQTTRLPKAHRGLRVRVILPGSGNISPYPGDNVDGYGQLAYYSSLVEFVALSDTRWKLIEGISTLPVTANSGGTISSNASCRTPSNANLSFRLTASAATFSLSIGLVSRDVVFFSAYNETQNRSLACYVHDNGTIAPYTSGAISNGDVILINVSYAIKY